MPLCRRRQRIEFRIGINVGDIIIDGDDIFGDGVNVAARLEGLARAGRYLRVRAGQGGCGGEDRIAFEDAGKQQLKNIMKPVRVYRVESSMVKPRSLSQRRRFQTSPRLPCCPSKT